MVIGFEEGTTKKKLKYSELKKTHNVNKYDYSRAGLLKLYKKLYQVLEYCFQKFLSHHPMTL